MLQVKNVSVLPCTLTNQMTITTFLSRQPCEHPHWLSQMATIRESVHCLCRDGTDVQYMQYLTKAK